MAAEEWFLVARALRQTHAAALRAPAAVHQRRSQPHAVVRTVEVPPMVAGGQFPVALALRVSFAEATRRDKRCASVRRVSLPVLVGSTWTSLPAPASARRRSLLTATAAFRTVVPDAFNGPTRPPGSGAASPECRIPLAGYRIADQWVEYYVLIVMIRACRRGFLYTAVKVRYAERSVIRRVPFRVG